MLSLKEYENIAYLILAKYKIKPTDENLGCIITGLGIADHKYDPTKGHLNYYRSLYANYYYGDIKKSKKKRKKEVQMSVLLSKDEASRRSVNFQAPDEKNYRSSEMLEFINSLNLTKLEKRIIYLRFWQNKKLFEIEEIENINFKKVHQIIKRVLKEIKNAIQLD